MESQSSFQANFQFNAGSIPLLVSMPHVGTDIPDDIAARLTPAALTRVDTDWHLVQLYGFLRQMGASTLSARWSRYVIDLNRPPENTNLYPGQDTTGLCPVDTFGKDVLYQPAQQPSESEVRQRLEQYWQPYHRQLQAELARMRQIHPVVVLWDAHSIASVVPRFFEGKLPDLNFGTADGKTCDPSLSETVISLAQAQAGDGYTCAVNGRFKGGYITRQYGQPASGVHAMQLEMCQSVYMNESHPFDYRHDLARQVQPLLQNMLEAAARWAGAAQ